MLDFFLFMLILLGFIAGTGVVYALVTRLSGKLEKGGEELSLPRLRDELDSLSVRLGRMEEELEFYKELRVPEEPHPRGALPGPLDQAP